MASLLATLQKQLEQLQHENTARKAMAVAGIAPSSQASCPVGMPGSSGLEGARMAADEPEPRGSKAGDKRDEHPHSVEAEVPGTKKARPFEWADEGQALEAKVAQALESVQQAKHAYGAVSNATPQG